MPQHPAVVDDYGKPIPVVDDSGKPIETQNQQPSVWRESIREGIHSALSSLPGVGPLLRHPKVADSIMDVLESAKNHPAATGAMAAGLATAPLTGGMSLGPAMAFSGLMAAGGAGAGLVAHDVANANRPGNIPTTKESASQIATQGLMGAGGELGARGLQALAVRATPAVSQWLYKMGLRPSTSMQRNFPSAIQTGLKEEIVPNTATIQARLSEVEKGLTDAVAKFDAARPKVAGLLGPAQPKTVTEAVPLGIVKDAAEEAGPQTAEEYAEWTAQRIANRYAPKPVKNPQEGAGGVWMRDRQVPTQVTQPAPGGAPPTMVAANDIAQAAKSFVLKKGKILDRGLKSETIAELEDLSKRYVQENAAPLTVTQALAQKRAEQALASAAYKTEARGGTINQLETLWHQGIANAARQQVLSRIPGAAEALAKEQGLIGLKDMAEVAANRPDVMGRYLKVAAALGGTLGGHPEAGLATAAIMAAVESPTLAGASALAIKKLGKGAASNMMPAIMKALGAAYGSSGGGQ